MLALGALAGARRGASLVELLVALALFGVVGLATLRSLDRQARFHSGVLSILESRGQHAAAHEALAVELRSVSSAAGDIGRLSDSAIVFRLPVGGAVACGVAPGLLDLAPDSTAAGQAFASFRTAPQAGDSAWILDEGARDVASDDAWIGLRITAVARAADRCIGTPFVDPVQDAGRLSWQLSVANQPPATVVAGAPIRLTRIARFALYRGGTGDYALGFAEMSPVTNAWIAIQPVSGPYNPFNTLAPATSGVALAGRDSSGTRITALLPGLPSALEVSTRTRSAHVVRIDGLARGRYDDSLHSLIMLRNAK